jgi:hypothetical protein
MTETGPKLRAKLAEIARPSGRTADDGGDTGVGHAGGRADRMAGWIAVLIARRGGPGLFAFRR